MIWKSLLYEEGKGVPQDSVKATELLHRAALSEGKVYATLGKLHYATALYLWRGVERNVDLAMKWFREAANEGNADALEFLRTSSHTSDRNTAEDSVGVQYQNKFTSPAQHLIPVNTETVPASAPYSVGSGLKIIILLFALTLFGALFRRLQYRSSHMKTVD